MCKVEKYMYTYNNKKVGKIFKTFTTLQNYPQKRNTPYDKKSLDGNVNVWINYANERSSSLRENGLEPAGSREKYKQPQTKARHLGENRIKRNTNTNINTEKILFRHGAW